MAEFTASPDVSGFTPQNALFNLPADIQAGQTIQQNQLLNQGKQIDLANANMAQVGQAAAGLLSAYPDEASRAAAYPRVVGMLQSQGFALHAPSEYPGEGVLRSMVNQSIPAKDLYSSGALMTPAQQALLGGNTGTTTSTTGTGTTGSVATAPAGTIEPAAFNNATAVRDGLIKRGMDPDTATGAAANALHESVANPRTGRGDNGNAAGIFMWTGPRLQAYIDKTGHPPDGAPLDEQLDFLMSEWNGSESAAAAKVAAAQGPAAKAAAFSQYFLRPKDTQGEMQRRSATALQLQQQIGGGTTTASAAPTTAQPGQPVPTQVAGPPMVSTAPAAPTAAPGGPPAAPQFTYPNGKVGGAPDAQGGVHYADGNYGTPPPGPRVPVAAAAPSPTPAQPGQPAQPQAAPTPAPAAAPAGTSRLPEASTIPTGQNSAPYKQAMQLQQQAMQYDAVGGTNPAFAKHAADLRLQAAGILQAGATVSAQQDGRPGTLEVVTGKFTPYTPLPSPRFSQPTIDPATGKPAIAAVSGSGTQYFPIPASPAQADYENMKAAYTGDIPTVKTIAESGRTAQASALQLNELADVIKGVQSGGILPEFRAKVAALMEANGAKPETIQAMTGMSSGSDAQVLQKLAVATIGASAKSDLGSNVGVESLNLYAGANPGMDKLQDANKRVTNMIRVAREQIDSYSLGAQQHFNQNQSTMLHTPAGQVPDYHPISEYNEKWQAQNNPQIGAAAIGILNGDGFDKWAARAGPEEALNAVRLAARIDPNIQIPVKGGGFKTAQEVLSHGTGQ